MAATGLTFQVTVTATGSTFDISSDDIVIVLASGTGSKIFFDADGAELKQIVVDEAPASIQTSSQMLIAVTDTTSAATFYVNADKVRQVLTNGTGSKISFDNGDTQDIVLSVTESRATVRTLIAGQVAESTGEFVTLTGTNTASSTNTWSGAQTFSHATTPVKTDKIVENTGAAGVTIDGALIKDSAFDTNVAAAGVTLSGTTLAADGTDANISITVTPKGTGSVQTIAGTAANPVYSFTGQADMGMYKSSATELAFATAGVFRGRISSAGLVFNVPLEFAGTLRNSETPQTLTGAGAINITTLNTLVVTTGANALTLADGAEGQFKIITMLTDAGDGTLTPTNLRGGTTVTFNDVGDSVILQFVSTKWNILSNFGCTVA